jgi:sortase (surface protein transpeptidase)
VIVLGLSVLALLAVPVVSAALGSSSGTDTTDPSAAPPATARPATTPSPSPTSDPSSAPVAVPVPSSAPSPGLVPAALSVPRLGISAAVVPTGVAEDGQAEIPEDIRRVGWYRFGPAAGAAAGSTVIVGHVDSFDQGKGALYPLRQAREGDRIVVAAEGADVEYRVTSVVRYDKVGLPLADLFRRDGSPVLTVITCGGPYNRSLGGYQQNLVVTAEPMGGPA